MGFSKVQEAIDSIAQLGMAVVVDDEDRENEGDLVMAAEAATPENIAFFLAHTSGVICVPLLPERADALELPLMVTANTEATVDLARAAGLTPAGVLCEIVTEDKSEMARLADLETFAKKHDLPFISIADLIRYRRQNEKLVRLVSEARIPATGREFRAYVYESVLDNEQHLALVMGDVAGTENVLVRVHSECLTGDVFGSLRCDCGPQLQASLDLIEKEGRGVLIYLRGHEGRGIGLGHKIRAYQLQEEGHDTVDANLQQGLPVDSREYGIGAQMLVDLGVTTMRLMTNNPVKYGGLEGFGLDITERVPLQLAANPENIAYLRTKRERMGHLLQGLDDVL
jgi:3,4-dihydroxy 2-butanone 4-phosphate synthase/GTP cyclohydrolase II